VKKNYKCTVAAILRSFVDGVALEKVLQALEGLGEIGKQISKLKDFGSLATG
jgi:hypothetical protein